MNYQKLLDAKIKLAEVNATTAIIVGAGILFVCAILLMVAYIKSKDSYSDETAFICTLTGAIGGIIGAVILCAGIYEKATVQIRAEADMSNYNLVEVVK